MIDEFAKEAIESSKCYYEYLKKMGRGREIIPVRKLVFNDDFIKLYLSKKLFDTDNLIFQVLGQEYSSEQLKIREYDRDENILYVNSSKDLKIDFRRLTADDIKLIVDLKFLVKRVEEWYKRYGDTLRFPERFPCKLPPTQAEKENTGTVPLFWRNSCL